MPGLQYVTWQYTCPRCRPHLHLCKTEHQKGFRAAWNRPPQQKDSLLFRLYAHNASFPPLARSPPHPDAILIGCILAHLLPVIGFVVAWAQRPCMVAHPCLSPGGHLSLCSAGTKQKTWIILPWTACACIRPPAPHLHADFFFSRSIKHPPAIVQFVRRPMCSYEPWLHSFLNEGSKSLTSFCLPGFYTGK